MPISRPSNALAPILIAVVAGCGDGKPYVDASLNEAPVKGVVTLKGKPVEAGEIIFDASNSERKVGQRSGPIGPDGSFTLTTYTGNNRIKVGGELLKQHPELFYIKKFYDVKRGENVAEIELMAEGEATDPKAKMPTKGAPKRR